MKSLKNLDVAICLILEVKFADDNIVPHSFSFVIFVRESNWAFVSAI